MKNKKKGFTLIELLAVIVILAIINVIEETKDKANRNSVYDIVDAVKLYYAENIADGNVPLRKNILSILKLSGNKPESGYVMINSKGETSVAASYLSQSKYGICSEHICTDKKVQNNNYYEDDCDNIIP